MRQYNPEIGPDQETEITLLTQRVHQDLNLDRGLIDRKPETRQKIAETIARTTYECCQILGIKLPDIQLMRSWDEINDNGDMMLGKKFRELGQTGYDEDTNLGITKYDPKYLREQAEIFEKGDILGNIIDFIYGLESACAHECHHLWALKEYPKQKLISSAMINDGESWFNNDLEYAADLFALFYIKNRKNVDFKIWVTRFMESIKLRLSLSRHRIQRRSDKGKTREQFNQLERTFDAQKTEYGL